MEKLKIKPITEEQISSVINYFDGRGSGNLTESQIWLIYGRMRLNGGKIKKAEEYLQQKEAKKAEEYKQKTENLMMRNKKDYEQTSGDVGKYELMKINEWENGRTMVLGFMFISGGSIKRSHVIEIEEYKNPTFFKEELEKCKNLI